MTAVESDIDRFIREQKSKLAQERDALVDDSRSRGEGARKRWDKSEGGVAHLAEQPTDDQKAAGYDYNQVHRRLLEEKKKDYNDLLEKQEGRLGRPGRGGPNEIDSPSIIPFDSNEAHAQKQRALKAERQREYNDMMAKADRPFRRGDVRTPPPEMMGLNVGQYEKTRQKLRNDMQREYREALEKQREEKQKLLARQHGLPTPEKDLVAGLPPRAPELSPRAAAPPAGLASRDAAPAYRRRSPEPSPTRAFQDNIFKQRDEPFKLEQDRELIKLQELNQREIELRKKLEEEKLMERLEQDRAELERLRLARKESAEKHAREEKLRQHSGAQLDDLDRRASKLSDKLDHERERAQELQERMDGKIDTQRQWWLYTPKDMRGDQERSYPRCPLATAKATLDPPGQGPIGDGERRHRQALEEERKDFLQHLEKTRADKPRRGWEEPLVEQGLALGGYEGRRRQLEEERHRDYLALQAQKQRPPEASYRDRNRDLPPKPPTPGGFLGRLGREKEEEQRKLKEELQRDLNQHLHDADYRGRRRPEDDDSYLKKFPGLALDTDSAKIRKIKERNEEYNQFLREKEDRERHRFDHRKPTNAVPQEKPDGSIYATLPGLRYSNSAKPSGVAERPPAAPRQGWNTPTYEDLLARKRLEEAQYRRYDDPELVRGTLKSYGSEGALNRLERPEPKIEWVLPPEKKQEAYATLPIGEFRKVKIPIIDQDDDGREERGSAQARQKQQYRQELEQQMRQAEENKRREKELGWKVDGSGYYKVADPLPLDVLLSQSPRSVVRLPPPPAKSSLRTRFIDDYDKLSARSEKVLARSRPSTDIAAPSKLDESALRLAGLDRGQRSRAATVEPPSTGILDAGFGSLLDPPRISLAPPPGLEYTPSSFITGGGGTGGGGSIDEAYRFYGLTNPLEPSAGGGGGGGGSELRLNLGDLDRGGRGGGGPSSNRVKFNDRVESLRRDEGPAGGLVFPSDAERKSKVDKASYQEELQRQMEEKRLKKLKDREEQERYDRKIEQEAKFYDPFGKGGGGAPLKDSRGQVITDLRQMRLDNNDPDSSRRRPNDPYSLAPGSYGGGAPGSYGGGGGGGSSYGGAQSYRDSYLSPRYGAGSPTKGGAQTNAEGEATHARGGHGIFGVAKTDEEKATSDKYKDDLRRQIEEKKQLKEIERQKALEEEAKENRRLEEQRRIMQFEYEEEQRKIKAKEEEAKRQNEELIRQAEERKKELELKRKEAEEENRRAREQERERERAEAARGSSPPVPAVKHRESAPNSRPASRKNSVPRAGSADVLNQLAHFRRQLQSERQRVETMLDESKREQETLEYQHDSSVGIDTKRLEPDSIIRTQSVVLGDSAREKYPDQPEPRPQTRTLLRNEPDIFDPRLVQRPPPAPVARQELDIFETAMNRGAVPVRRAPTTDHANPSALADFQDLKYQEDSDSRRQFREQYPGDPNSGGDLEAQQAALLRQQEQRLRAIREGRGQIEPTAGPSRDLGLNRQPTLSPQPMLDSKSAFIDYNGVGSFPDDFEDLPRRNDSARARRRDRNFSVSSRPPTRSRDPMGSDTSLNVDRIAKKNEDRLRRLKELQGDDVSLYDPDDVIDRFMAKQAHNRNDVEVIDLESAQELFTPV